MRTGLVAISGTNYEPPVPDYNKTCKELNGILSAPDETATDKALQAFCRSARGQFFWDGNKRTSLTLANKILIMTGAGILTITDKHMSNSTHCFSIFITPATATCLKKFYTILRYKELKFNS